MTMDKRKLATVSFRTAGSNPETKALKRNRDGNDTQPFSYHPYVETKHGTDLQPPQLGRLQSGELAVVSTLCNMLPNTPQRTTVMGSSHDYSKDSDDEDVYNSPSPARLPPPPTRKELGQRLQTPDKAAVSALYNLAHAGDDSSSMESSSSVPMDTATNRVDDDDDSDISTGSVDANPRPMKKKRRPRDLSKPTLETLVRDKFDGDVFAFLNFVEHEMQQHNFTATGLARKLDAENCQSRFRTICAELREESIVGISKLWRERVQAYLRTRRGEEEGLINQLDHRIRRVGPVNPVKSSSNRVANNISPVSVEMDHNGHKPCEAKQQSKNRPKKEKKRKRDALDDEGTAKTTLEKILADKFQGDAFQFLAFVEKEVHMGTSATGIAKKLNAVNCQSRFRTIVAELKQEPIVGMSRLWKERIHAYICSKESQQHEVPQEFAPNTPSADSKDDPLRIVHENAKLKNGVPGTVGMLVHQNFGSNVNRFLSHLEEEMHFPGFSSAKYAQEHNITEGKKVLSNIVAELQGLSNTSLTLAWKEHVQRYKEDSSHCLLENQI
jgi:hypothetical protein